MSPNIRIQQLSVWWIALFASILGVCNVASTYAQNDAGILDTLLRVQGTGRFTAIAEFGNTILVGGRNSIWVSSDAGVNWIVVDLEPESNAVWSFEKPGDFSFLAATDNFIYRSDNGGMDWAPLDPQNSDAITDLVTLRSGRILALGETNIYQSDNGGISWSKQNFQFEYRGTFIAVESEGLVLAGSRGCFESSCGELWATIDEGETWQNWSLKIEGHAAYSGVILDHGRIIVKSDYGVYISIDRGFSFQFDRQQELDYADHLIYANEQLLYAVWYLFLFQSTDRGSSWMTRLRLEDESFEASHWAIGSQRLYLTTLDGSVDPAASVLYYLIPTSTSVSDSTPGYDSEVFLDHAYPNPFISATTVSYLLPNPKTVTLDLFDLTGRRVRKIEEGFRAAGEHEVQIEAGELSAGIYFLRMAAGEFVHTKKMIVLN